MVSKSVVQEICKNSSDYFCRIFSEIEPQRCVIRGIKTNVTEITDLGTLVVSCLSIIMVFILATKAYSKVSAVGRKEMFIFLVAVIFNFVFIILNESFRLENDAIMEWMRIIGISTRVMAFWALLFFGFVGFQLIPDGSAMSVFLMFLTTFALGIASGYVTYLVEEKTTPTVGAFQANNAAAISLSAFIIILPLISIIAYLLTQVVIVYRYLAVRKPLIWLGLILIFFALRVIFNNVLSYTICNGTDQAIDGTMFATCSQILAVFSIYRFWYSITEDEIEDEHSMYKY
ncbi:hypothetical protein BB561_002228 [Smittium simulii]|uniref:Uncharacterized protein n=1 Tax=Smittium simulii TaxID=133385 RepID=A0A2T9YR46_9FUNG|nr:hypothetical protein BB561_002228 [Smittium simulii]